MRLGRYFIEKEAASAIDFPRLYNTPILCYTSCAVGKGPISKVAIMVLGSNGTRVKVVMNKGKCDKLVGIISGTPNMILHWQSKYGIPKKNSYNYENLDEIKGNSDIDDIFEVPRTGQKVALN